MQLAARSSLADRFGSSLPVILWALAGFALYLLLGVASILATAMFDPLFGAIGLPVQAGELGLSVRNAIQPLVWGLLVAGISAPIGRRLVPGIRYSRDGWLVLIAGLALASVTWLLIEEFVRLRMSYFDTEYVGFAILAWPALVAIALCGWAALAVPRGSSVPLAIALVIAAAGLSIALLPSIPGVADGIDADSIPLAITFVIDLAYAALCIVLTFRHAARPSLG